MSVSFWLWWLQPFGFHMMDRLYHSPLYPFTRLMELIQWLQTIAYPPLVSCVFPLLIIGCFVIAFGRWLYPTGQTLGWVYVLSLLTAPLLDVVLEVSERQLATIAGIFAPTLYSLLLLLVGAIRALNLPSGIRNGRGGSRSRVTNPLVQFGRGLVGGSVGGILGIAVGVWVGVLLVAILFLVAYPPLVTSDSLRAEETVQIILNSSIYPLGILGIGFGVLEGFGQIHVRQMGDRFLINAVIYSAMISALFRKLLRIPPVSRWWQRMHPTSVESKPTLAITRPTSHHPFDRLPEFSSDGADAFEINRQGDILTLRRRTYRTSDWVWMGFNGLYNLLALLVGAIALLRGTWVMMGFGINILLVLAAVWTWHSLTQLINYTTITLNPKSLSRRDTPLVSSAVSLRVPLYQIAEVKALMPSNPPLSYHVCLVLTNGRQLILLKNLDRQEEATFLESQINRFLRDRW